MTLIVPVALLITEVVPLGPAVDKVYDCSTWGKGVIPFFGSHVKSNWWPPSHLFK